MFNLYKKIMMRFSYSFRLKELIKGGLIIGENVKLYNVNFDHSHSYLISIGNNVTITNSDILAHDASTKMILGKTKVGRISIGNNVFIGYRCIILPDVSIGDNVILGAGSVVNCNIPSNCVAAGNPCKVVGDYHDFVIKHKEYFGEKPKFNSYLDKNNNTTYKKNMIRKLSDTFGYDE